jgi:hypothetical protein
MRTTTRAMFRILPDGIASEAELFVAFRNHYLDLVELVCDAAQGGVDPEMAASYVLHTGWFRQHWVDVRAWVLPWAGGDDPIAPLFTPVSLQELLESDGGRLIQVLQDGQSALEDWESALRREEALA